MPWLELPDEVVFLDDGKPFLARSSERSTVLARLRDAGFQVAAIDVTDANDTYSVIQRLRAVLSFPSWCGSGWDSINDAYEELRAAWPFPLALCISGLAEVFNRNPKLALKTVVRLHNLADSFGLDGDQMEPLYFFDEPGPTILPRSG